MEISRNCTHCVLSGKSPDTGRHLQINTVKKVQYCYRCGFRGRWDGAMLPTDEAGKPPKEMREIELYSFNIEGKDHRELVDYLKGRLPWDVVLAKLRWSPQLPKRVVFPVWSGEDLVMWQARTVEEGVRPKYLSSGRKSEVVYGFEDAEDYCTLTEGPFDALSSPNGVCVFGKDISEIQHRLLTSKFRTIYWALDPDTQGSKREEALKESLKQLVEVIDVPLEEGVDPADLGMEEMKRRIDGLRSDTSPRGIRLQIPDNYDHLRDEIVELTKERDELQEKVKAIMDGYNELIARAAELLAERDELFDEHRKLITEEKDGDFVNHLKKVTETVHRWPEWKQKLLGVSIKKKGD